MTNSQLPSGALLLQREAEARRHGSGMGAATLEGEWVLERLWSRRGVEQPGTAALLRSLRASLTIQRQRQLEAGSGLLLRNSVDLGPLSLQFTGPGWLTGTRPLLRFRFERLALCWGERELWHSALPAPAQRAMPFFALIACERSATPAQEPDADPALEQAGDQGWLAARGRGGGLAAWRLRPSADRG